MVLGVRPVTLSEVVVGVAMATPVLYSVYLLTVPLGAVHPIVIVVAVLAVSCSVVGGAGAVVNVATVL